jgi:hypothetical protein
MGNKANVIRWYPTELEIMNVPDIHIPISKDDIEAVTQDALSKSNFIVVAN